MLGALSLSGNYFKVNFCLSKVKMYLFLWSISFETLVYIKIFIAIFIFVYSANGADTILQIAYVQMYERTKQT